MTQISKRPVTRLDYCQFLLSSQINYTLTYFADHSDEFSYDAVNRYLVEDRVTPYTLWEMVQGQIVPSPLGFVIFDDMVLAHHSQVKALSGLSRARA